MGTSIKCFTSKKIELHEQNLKSLLDKTFKNSLSKLKKIESFENNSWQMNNIEQENKYPEYVSYEGYGFSINIYEKVICITSYDRFSSLYLKGNEYADNLNEIFTEIINEIGDVSKIMFLQGGYGDEELENLAYLKKFSFEEISKVQNENQGNPARKLTDLFENSWYLK
ncbi:hypothetical protein [Flavobacterium sp.]|uniref:hypothetical protein n=1 Tax=Flavobacterium sp. TaxID=239 RepID=UPI0039E6912B